jgi:prophage antirepressor-like protein
VHGTHYVFKDTTIHVLEDDDTWRWLPLADVERVLGRKLNARLLAITYPDRLELGGKPARMHMRDDALIEHLSKLSDPMALRFRTWVDRSVALPARRIRQRAAGQAVDSF